MNYIDLINNFWNDVRFLDGYKNQYWITYSALIDSCNRNYWKPTKIHMETILDKTGIGKRMMYESIEWLSFNKLIVYTSGKNGFSMASYEIIEVSNCTATDTSTDTATDTSTAPQRHPFNKQVNNKTIKQENNKQNVIDLIFPFETDNFKNTWNQFIEFRKSIKKPLKEISQQAQLLKLSKYSEHDATEMILQSIANGWQGIFEIKNNTQNGKSNHNMEQKPTDNPLIGRIRAKDLAEFMRPRHNNQSNQS